MGIYVTVCVLSQLSRFVQPENIIPSIFVARNVVSCKPSSTLLMRRASDLVSLLRRINLATTHCPRRVESEQV